MHLTLRRHLLPAAVCVACTASIAQVEPALWVSVDMPHGGCNLTVASDGGASIHFGAMPKRVRVTPGTFDFAQVVSVLRENSYPQSARSLTKGPVGSVSLPNGGDLLFIDDITLVRSLLQRAWSARVAPATTRELEDYNWVSDACSLR